MNNIILSSGMLADYLSVGARSMSKREELLAAAQSKVRSGGYSNFSFRELATEVGIKSASVHYHFPTKSDLGAELARQYTDDFLTKLGDPLELFSAGNNPIDIYIKQFRRALIKDKKMCLCGLLGAESDGLPDKVRYETKRFFERNIVWLEQAYKVVTAENNNSAKTNAIKTISLLEGAMLVSKTLGDNQVFEQAVIGLPR
jgi:TetR/AcrR family transcriptional repressor of nem operon